jgi:hypothetical protein
VFARLGKSLVVVALVLSTGLHWAALQTFAWTTMLASNLCTQSVSQAVTHTFDGEHLCPLCKAIAAAKKSEKKSDAVSASSKMEFPPVAQKIILHPPAQFETLPVANAFAESLAQKPPTPPPRGLFV